MNNDNLNNIPNEELNIINIEEVQNETQKKKRGRPKGSKNKPKTVHEVLAAIRSPVEQTTSFRPQRKVAKRPSDTLFIIKPRPGSKCYYSTEITVDYTPHKEQDHSERQSIVPKLNTDNKPHVPGFVMEMDRNYYDKHDSRYKEEHKNKILDYTKPKSRLYQPKPGKRHNYCCVCKQSYDDYLDHVSSAMHKKQYNNNEFSKLIKGINAEYSVRLQQAKLQENSDELCETYTNHQIIDDDLLVLTDTSNTLKQYHNGKNHHHQDKQSNKILPSQNIYNLQAHPSNSSNGILLGQQQQLTLNGNNTNIVNNRLTQIPSVQGNGQTFTGDLYNTAYGQNNFINFHPDYQQASSVFLQNKAKSNPYGYNLELGQNPHLNTSSTTCLGLSTKQASQTTAPLNTMGLNNPQQQQQQSNGFQPQMYQQPFFLNFTLSMNNSTNIENTNDLMVLNQPQLQQQQQSDVINLNHSHHSFANSNNLTYGNKNPAAMGANKIAHNHSKDNLNLSNHHGNTIQDKTNNINNMVGGICPLNGKRKADTQILFCDALENPHKQFVYQPSLHTTNIYDFTDNEPGNINTGTTNITKNNNQVVNIPQNPGPPAFLRCPPQTFLL